MSHKNLLVKFYENYSITIHFKTKENKFQKNKVTCLRSHGELLESRFGMNLIAQVCFPEYIDCSSFSSLYPLRSQGLFHQTEFRSNCLYETVRLSLANIHAHSSCLLKAYYMPENIPDIINLH